MYRTSITFYNTQSKIVASIDTDEVKGTQYSDIVGKKLNILASDMNTEKEGEWIIRTTFMGGTLDQFHIFIDKNLLGGANIDKLSWLFIDLWSDTDLDEEDTVSVQVRDNNNILREYLYYSDDDENNKDVWSKIIEICYVEEVTHIEVHQEVRSAQAHINIPGFALNSILNEDISVIITANEISK